MTQHIPAPTVHDGKLIWEASDIFGSRWPKWFIYRGERFNYSTIQRRDGEVTAVSYAGERGSLAIVFND